MGCVLGVGVQAPPVLVARAPASLPLLPGGGRHAELPGPRTRSREARALRPGIAAAGSARLPHYPQLRAERPGLEGHFRFAVAERGGGTSEPFLEETSGLRGRGERAYAALHPVAGGVLVPERPRPARGGSGTR